MLTSHQHESNGGRKLGIADLFTLVPTERVGLGPNHFIHVAFKAQFSFSKRLGLPLWLPGPTMCKKRMQNGCVVHQSPESIILLNQGGQSKSPSASHLVLKCWRFLAPIPYNIQLVMT